MALCTRADVRSTQISSPHLQRNQELKVQRMETNRYIVGNDWYCQMFKYEPDRQRLLYIGCFLNVFSGEFDASLIFHCAEHPSLDSKGTVSNMLGKDVFPHIHLCKNIKISGESVHVAPLCCRCYFHRASHNRTSTSRDSTNRVSTNHSGTMARRCIRWAAGPVAVMPTGTVTGHHLAKHWAQAQACTTGHLRT